MKIINQQIVKVPSHGFKLNEIYRDIERAGRNCYKSENKTTENSATSFVEMLINKKHLSPLEFGTIYLTIPTITIAKNPLLQALCSYIGYTKRINDGENVYITTNLRALIEYDSQLLKEIVPYLTKPTIHIKRHTFRLITDRGVMAEITRHRKLSFCIESTRYCNYSTAKFGNELTFINQGTITPQLQSLLQNIENQYLQLTSNGVKPEMARAILPTCLKTEILLCGFESDLNEVIEKRLNGTHPLMKDTAEQMKQLLKKIEKWN